MATSVTAHPGVNLREALEAARRLGCNVPWVGVLRGLPANGGQSREANPAAPIFSEGSW
jgi:hypothetical protein